MPTIPRPQCGLYNCKAPTVKGSSLCIEHAPPVVLTDTRRAFNAPYKTRAWELIRAQQLSRAPLCAACKLRGYIISASDCDHLIAWQAVGAYAFKINRFQSLCNPCHALKSSLEKRGIYRHYTDTGAIDYTLHDYPRLMGY
jgi:5-methylcytosine-specific restriction endonuclease McrA